MIQDRRGGHDEYAADNSYDQDKHCHGNGNCLTAMLPSSRKNRKGNTMHDGNKHYPQNIECFLTWIHSYLHLIIPSIMINHDHQLCNVFTLILRYDRGNRKFLIHITERLQPFIVNVFKECFVERCQIIQGTLEVH